MAEIRPRTAYDLERKYNLSNIAKAVENTSTGLTKVNNEINNYAIKIDSEIAKMQERIDNGVTTWFYSGEPTLENEPAINWTTDELKKEHIGDMYYDKDTAKVYKFVVNNNVYSWNQVEDTALSQVLAIANSAKDTADSKRRVFTDQPTPPYDSGDLWFKEDEDGKCDLYRCRLGKSSNEEYADTDWIVATKYTDDSMAQSLFGDLQTTLEENYPTTIELNKTVDGLESRVADTYYTIQENEQQRIEITNEISTSMTETSKGWNLQFKELNDTVVSQGDTITENQNTLTKYIQFVDGTIVLASDGGQIKLKIENNKIAFINSSNTTIGYWTPTSFQLGNYAYIPRENGSLDFKKVG